MGSLLDAAPRFLDPVLGTVERIDRWRRRLRPARTDALLWVEERQHGGDPVRLADGTTVRRGDRVCAIHFDNRRLRELSAPAWQTAAHAAARADLRALAHRHVTLPAGRRPVAYWGATLLTSLTRRAGFEIRERRRTPRVRLEDWYLRSLLVRWSPDGRARLRRGSRALVTREGWLSGSELLRRYGDDNALPSAVERA
jgi:hypothetical protein